MSRKDRFFAALPWMLASLFIAGIVHIVAILLMPDLALKDAYATLTGSGPGEQDATSGVRLVTPATSPGALAFQDPAMTVGVCYYDLALGPRRVQMRVSGDGFFSLSFHDRTGGVFYSMTDRAALRGKVDIVLVDGPQLEAMEANDPEDQAPQDLRLLSPARVGYVLVRALVERPGQAEDVAQFVQSVSCKTEKF